MIVFRRRAPAVSRAVLGAMIGLVVGGPLGITLSGSESGFVLGFLGGALVGAVAFGGIGLGFFVCQVPVIPLALVFAQPVAFVVLLLGSAEVAAHPRQVVN